MKDSDYKERLARTRAADAAHSAMLDWYAIELKADRTDIARVLATLPQDLARKLYTKYQEQL